MSSGSWRDTVKALNITFAEPTVTRHLSYDLQETLQVFLDRYTPGDDVEADRIHEDLLAIYRQHVAQHPSKLSPWLNILRALRPALHGDRYLLAWWTLVVKPILAEIGQQRDTIEDAREFVLAVTLYDPEEDKSGEAAGESHQYIGLLLKAFLARTNLPQPGIETNLQEDEFVAQELENVLVAFGRKMPKNLLRAIDDLLVSRDSRLQALSLLSSFVRLQPPHLHSVLETNLLRHLLDCLLIDTSATVVDLALTNLIMFLPHITSALVPLLPKLFLVYARVLCWDDYKYEHPEDSISPIDAEKSSPPATQTGVFEFDPSWEPFNLAIEADSILPKANYLFTFLYGLFPLNFMTFVRKPRRYLKMKSYPNAEILGLNQGMIRTRTEAHRETHLLHPNFFSTTPEDELVDNRWLKSDPADLVSECLALCVPTPPALSNPGPPPNVSLPPLPRNVHARGESETIPAAVGGLSPILDASSQQGEHFKIPPRQSSRASITARSTRSSRNTSPTVVDFPEKPAMLSSSPESRSHFAPSSFSEKSMSARRLSKLDTDRTQQVQGIADALTRSPTIQSIEFPKTPTFSASNLHREIIILRNDLNFEKYLKQQHLTHIGQLQRKNINDATIEAETQNLINTNRNLQQKLTKSNEMYAQLKKETAAGRNQAKRFEEQLSTKLKIHRDEERRLRTELDKLNVEYDKLKRDCEDMRSLVVESEIREHHTRNALTTLQREFEATDLLKKQIADLESRVQDYELLDLSFERTKDDDYRLRNELESVRMELESRDVERDRTRKLYDSKISILEARLRNAVNATQSDQMPASVQQMIDSALAASNNKLAHLKRTHQRLLHKYTELELKAQELEGNQHILEYEHKQLRSTQQPQQAHREGPRPASVLSLTQYADDAAGMSFSDSPHRRQNSLNAQRRLHAFADPALYETSHAIPEDDYTETISPQRPAFGYERNPSTTSNVPRHDIQTGLTKRPSQSLAQRSAMLNADRMERLAATDRSAISSAGTGDSYSSRSRVPEIAPVAEASHHDFAAPAPRPPSRTQSGPRAANQLNSLVAKHLQQQAESGVRYHGRGGYSIFPSTARSSGLPSIAETTTKTSESVTEEDSRSSYKSGHSTQNSVASTTATNVTVPSVASTCEPSPRTSSDRRAPSSTYTPIHPSPIDDMIDFLSQPQRVVSSNPAVSPLALAKRRQIRYTNPPPVPPPVPPKNNVLVRPALPHIPLSSVIRPSSSSALSSNPVYHPRPSTSPSTHAFPGSASHYGGAQSKVKKEKEGKDKDKVGGKSGGFRGLKGIM